MGLRNQTEVVRLEASTYICWAIWRPHSLISIQQFLTSRKHCQTLLSFLESLFVRANWRQGDKASRHLIPEASLFPAVPTDTGKQYTALSSGGTTREEKNSCSNRLNSAWQGPWNTGRPPISLSCHWRAAAFLWYKPGWQASQCVCSYWKTEARGLKVKLCLCWFLDVWLNGNTLRGQDWPRFLSSSRCLLTTLPTAFSITQLFLAGKRPLGSLLER